MRGAIKTRRSMLTFFGLSLFSFHFALLSLFVAAFFISFASLLRPVGGISSIVVRFRSQLAQRSHRQFENALKFNSN